METRQLKELLELLKEYGVTEYSNGSLSLKLGGSISVHKHASGPGEPREVKREIDPELIKKFNRLPAGYQQAFTLGEG